MIIRLFVSLGVLMGTTLFVVTPSLGFAQGLIFDCDGAKPISADEGARLIEKVQKAYESVTTIHGLFDQESYMAALDISELSSGTVQFKKPGLMKWVYESPTPQEFIVSKSTFWFYQKEKKQALVNSLEKAFLTDLPVSFLLGVGNLSNDFAFVTGCSRNDGVILSLTSKKNKDKLKSLKLLVHPSTFVTQGAFVEDVGGNITTIVLRNIVTNKVIADSEFSPVFPPDTDIDDQRSLL